MEGFQKTVLFSAIFILIVTLVVIGMALSYAKSSESWPPIVSECPDWWRIDGSGNATTCTNVKDLGICPAQNGEEHQKMNFNMPLFTGDSGECNKYNWANKCKVSWDGVTYGVANPCTL